MTTRVLLVMSLLACLFLTLAPGRSELQGTDDRARELASSLRPIPSQRGSGDTDARSSCLPETLGFGLQFVVGASILAFTVSRLALRSRGPAQREA